MTAYVLTGTPGSGKTAMLRQLEVNGYAVVEEAATDVIALGQALGEPSPWERPGFIERITALQVARAGRTDPGRVTVLDRSPICTLALCRYSGFEPPRGLLDAIGRMEVEQPAFFVRNQGFVTATEARRISFDQSLKFERIHEETYAEIGFPVIDVPPGPLAERVAQVERIIGRPGPG